MVFSTSVRAWIESYPVRWSSGKEIVSVRVLLGQQSKSSNCEITLADPTGSIAEALIRHTLESGGLQMLPSPEAKPNMAVPGNATPANSSSTALAALTPERRAFLDALAEKESNGQYNIINGGATFSDYSRHPFEGSNQILGTGVAAGRYQFMPGTWGDLRRKHNYPDFSQANQDQAAIDYIRDLGCLGLIDSGDIAGAARRLQPIWTSLPGAAETQWNLPEFLAFYNQRLAAYRGGQPQTIGEKAQPATTTQAAQPATAASVENFKGSKLFVEVSTGSNVAPYVFEYFHQGTYTDQDGLTKLTGQGIRWVLNRRRRNEGHSNKSLKQLAEDICKSQGLTLDWQAQVNPDYEYIDQSGISDYQLLLREAENAGLFVSEANGKLTVKQLDNLRDIDLTLMPGLNLISYKVEDRAIDVNQEESSSLDPQASKYDLDPVTGQFRQSQPDVDPVNDKSATGKAQGTPTGTLKPGQDATVTTSRQRYKRVKGLPSTFVLPMSDSTLILQPLDAVRTTGLPGVLSRIWLVDSVAHELADGQTTIDCYSPVEVVDLTPQTLAPGEAPSSNPGGYIFPTKGSIVTDIRRYRSATRYHHGLDLAGTQGDPTYAMAAGVVTTAVTGCVVGASECGGGYGNWVEISHPDGYSTRYAHLSSVSVRVGQQVTQGQNLGGQGTTGGSTGVHLHVEVRDSSNNSCDFSVVGLRNPAVGETI